jgi:hypothetical protein
VLFWINPFLMACWKNVWGFLVLGMLFCADNHVHVNSSDLFSVFFLCFLMAVLNILRCRVGFIKILNHELLLLLWRRWHP